MLSAQDQNFEYDANVKKSRGNITFGTRRILQILLTNFPLFRLEISTKFFRTNYILQTMYIVGGGVDERRQPSHRAVFDI